ncbi:MAG: hypothetical protein ABI488_00190 [Polyangiaceae bacterium]
MAEETDALWNYVRATYPDRVAALEAVPVKYQAGLLVALIAVEVALAEPRHPIVPEVAKWGRGLQRDFLTGDNVPGRRRLVLVALERHAGDPDSLASALAAADPGFAALSRARLADVMAAHTPGRPGRGSQGLTLTAARLSVACKAFRDKREGDAQAAFKAAQRGATRVRVARRGSSK